jgi:hypothetical protein
MQFNNISAWKKQKENEEWKYIKVDLKTNVEYFEYLLIKDQV